MRISLIKKLIDFGFSINSRSEALDCDCYKVVEDDTNIIFIKYTNATNQITEWQCNLADSMGDDKLALVIKELMK